MPFRICVAYSNQRMWCHFIPPIVRILQPFPPKPGGPVEEPADPSPWIWADVKLIPADVQANLAVLSSIDQLAGHLPQATKESIRKVVREAAKGSVHLSEGVSMSF